MLAPSPRHLTYEAYWAFAAERHSVFERRLQDVSAPWTRDPVIATYRFCNVFRAADRVSQHLIAEAAYGSSDLENADLFLRVVLHRLFCKTETWDLLVDELGDVRAESFSAACYGDVLDRAFGAGRRLYTGAFILCANRAYGHARKHRNHLALLEAMIDASVPERIAEAQSLGSVFRELRSWPLLGPFMAYQLAVDLNYSPLICFDENDFTVPGPGALRGLAKVFRDLGDLSPAEAVHWLVEQQDGVEDRFGIDPPTLFGRRLHAIDCQNLLCEFDKYARAAFPELASDRSRIKQRFTPDPSAHPLFFPPEWGINEFVPESRRHVDHPAPV